MITSPMEAPDKTLSDIVKLFTSWLPRRSEPANVSRDFWMPDHSCRVCYDCDTQFTIFNRRHHCRRCGRIFCGKCTANSIPASEGPDSIAEEGDRIRVCNFCFKQWEQERAAVAVKRVRPTLSPSLSASSLVTTKSTVTVNSVGTTAGSHSAGNYQHVARATGTSPHNNCQDKASHEKQDIHVPEKNLSIVSSKDESSSVQFGYYTNRSDDEDEEYSGYRSDRHLQHGQHSDRYYGPDEFGRLDSCYNSAITQTAEENISSKDISPRGDGREFPHTLPDIKLEYEPEPDNSSECEAASSIYAMESIDMEPVDFENNRLLWLPPEPEDEEDEVEADLLDDDDDEPVAVGEWGRLQSSSSFGSGESRSRDQSSEEHKKAMKGVVDGHFRALISQLLQVENIAVHEGDDKSWLEIITLVSWEAANFLKPDTSRGGGMDPGGYVKVKCLACGHRCESTVIKGVVCKKNVAHRRMTSQIERPRFLLLGGALEYQRVTNLLSSIDTLLQQERDHLKMAVAKIVAQKPNLILVEKTVARYAQDLLLEKDISLVLNIKRPLLERIARCTGAQIVPSIDHLSSQKLGYCELFHVDKYFEYHEGGGQVMKKTLKTMMFFEGCPKPLGCTVLLKGGTMDELKKIKHVVQYGIFAAYHLALETSFLADEGATLPELPLKSPIAVALPDKPSNVDSSISTVPGFTVPVSDKQQASPSSKQLDISGFKVSTYSDGIATEVSPISNEHCDSQPTKPTSSFNIKTGDASDIVMGIPSAVSMSSLPTSGVLSNSSPSHSTAGKSNICYGNCHEGGFTRSDGEAKDSAISKSPHLQTKFENSSNFADSSDLKDPLGASNSLAMMSNRVAEQPVSSSAVRNQEFGQRHENTSNKEDIVPSDHQSILVSLSTRCVWKGTVCERSQLFRIKYYGNFDKPLGRFLRDHLFDQCFRCRSCDMPSEAHVHCYTHRQGSLTIAVRKLPECPLPGERDGKIWMWHRCLRCPRSNGFPPATQRVVMSDAAWGLSFGKFLELSFSNNAAASRVACCGHSLHRDCLRFYGFGKMVACFRYAPINVHSVYVPPHKLEFGHQPLDWIQKEANELVARAELLFDEILRTLRLISDKRTNVEVSHHILELEGMLRKEKSEFEECLNKVLKREVRKGQLVIDILEINRLRRQLLFHSYLWDQRLIFAARSDRSPHEFLYNFRQRDNEKLLPVEKPMDSNAMEKTQNEQNGTNAVPEDPKANECLQESIHEVNCLEGADASNGHSNSSQHMDRSESDSIQRKDSKTSLYSSISVSEELVPLEPDLVARRTLSDGQFASLLDVSGALEAKWTGKNDPTLTSANVSDCMAVSEDSEEQNGNDSTPSFTSLLLNKLGDSAEDLSSWLGMPFLHFYRSLNKHWGRSHRFDALNEYSPVYVSFLQGLERQTGPKFLLPIGVNDIVVGIYDDEPTSIISYALVSHQYHIQLSDERERDSADAPLPLSDLRSASLTESIMDETASELSRSFLSTEDSALTLPASRSSPAPDPLIHRKAMHVRVNFADESPLGKGKYTVTCYYAKQFDALRRICCPSEVDFIRSLSRCKKWGAQGGKSNVFFAKSLDDRFIVKQVTKTELESFMKFAPEYFKYLSESIGTGSPTCMAKILGIYQVIKSLKGGKEMRMDVLVMENLLFERHVTRLYDLKGSTRSRYNPDSNGSNKVLLDQNLIEAMPTSPIFVGNKAKRLLERAVWNDTSFLASIDVMDYSLLVGVDEEKHELVMGIIDFMRQYTWDKHLETWVKASGILGGPKNASPTVISPKQYKKRFRKAMSAYFLVVPDQWSPPATIPSK